MYAVQEKVNQQWLDWQEEDGLATMLTTIGLMFAMLALMLLFIPSITNFTTRRVAQNGSDAAVHAAAVKFTEDFSISFGWGPNVPYVDWSMGWCVSDGAIMRTIVRDTARQRTVQLFKLAYTGFPSTPYRAQAEQYARTNNTDLRQFSSYVTPIYTRFNYNHTPSRETLYPRLFETEADRNFTEWTGGAFDVPGYAAALAYVTDIDAPLFDNEIPHPPLSAARREPCFTWIVMYDYTWEMSLVQRMDGK